ncbi:MAG TPA: MFS transporter [Pseudonocardiaceae bacterium]
MTGMRSALAHPVYRRLLAAQVVALLGSGLATVALGLLAYRLAGPAGGAVLGTALAVKMLAYVLVAPLAGALAGRLPRRAFLVTADLLRATVALALPFVTTVWQVYALIVVLQVASAAFTPAFQATVPDVLADEEAYTAALALSRLAHDLEALAGPLLAAALLTVAGFPWLFAGTAAGFVASALLVRSVRLPRRRAASARPDLGVRAFLAAPALRGLLAVNLTVAAAGAMVLVNTPVLVRHHLGRPAADVALALGAFGAGSMAAAFATPALLRRVPERRLLLAAGALLAGTLAALVPVGLSWPVLLAAWALFGAGTALVLTPSGRLLRRTGPAAGRPALFAAWFALSHACWLLTYPLAGRLGATSMTLAAAVLAALATLAVPLAAALWPAPARPAAPPERFPAVRTGTA